MGKMIVGWFIGENSKKRQIGVAVAFLLSFLYFTDVITLEIYEATMPFVIMWVGAAFSARLSKIAKAVVEAKR
ncbi:MAG: hypothetical protein KAU50_02445 [Candidatus Marinimicrobia bacterium]|nr:hypothetical protein [Candidatus Neomarinimicrobiota bacterium]